MDSPTPLSIFRIRRATLERLCQLFKHAGPLAVTTLSTADDSMTLSTSGNGFVVRSELAADDFSGRPQRDFAIARALLDRLADRLSTEWIDFEEHPRELIVQSERDVFTLPTQPPEELEQMPGLEFALSFRCNGADLARTIRAGMVSRIGRSRRGDARFRGLRIATEDRGVYVFSTTGREGFEARSTVEAGTIDVTLPPLLADALADLSEFESAGSIEMELVGGALIAHAGSTVARFDTHQPPLPDHRQVVLPADKQAVQITTTIAALRHAFCRLDVEADKTRTTLNVLDGQFVLCRNGRAARVCVSDATTTGLRRAKITIPTTEVNRWLASVKATSPVTVGFTPIRDGKSNRAVTFESECQTYIASPID